VSASLAEAAYALDHLGALGLTVYTDAGKLYLGDPLFEPLWAELDRRGAVVFVHPHAPECCSGLVPNVPDTLIEFGAATTRTLASLLFNRVTLRFPNVRWIFPHGGGAMPFLIERFLAGGEVELIAGVKTRGGHITLPVPPETVLSELRRLHFDTAQIANPASLGALKTIVGSSQILYGTDYWFRTEVETREAVERCRVFSPAELDRIASGNAERLIPALAKA
jgi:predicted TIM-barrel fold metal-dependent hydrolase